MSLSDRSRAFLKAEACGNPLGLLLSACPVNRLRVRRRKYARRWHWACLEIHGGLRITFTIPAKGNRT